MKNGQAGSALCVTPFGEQAVATGKYHGSL